MIKNTSRSLRLVFALLVALFGSFQAVAAPPQTDVPWLYVGSDVPVDKDWLFGVLPNGLRYAVRRNAVPAHQVAVRVAIDAGSLMENTNELGYAHFIEHLSFRGSKYAGDGEAKRVWQRLGTTFGSDTNAQTTTTQTIYKLDLPNATRDGLTESLKLLFGMMSAPSLTSEEVDAERRTVMAEARESAGADQRLNNVSRQLFFAGQLLATRPPIGTTETLVAATPKKLRAFHDRWYRPERTVVVIAGDADPTIFAALIAQQFGEWKGTGRAPKEPDFGMPTPTAKNTAVVTEGGLPISLTMSYARPWVPHNDTIVYNQGKLIETVALKILNRRLEARARRGQSFLFAGAEQSDISRSVDETALQMTPLNGDWVRGLTDLRGMIAEAVTTRPTQAEIDREIGEFVSELDASVEQAKADTGSKLADSIVGAVNIRETVASPVVARDVFGAMQGKVSPEAILAATRRLFSGVGPRVLLSTTSETADAEARLNKILSTPAVATVSAQDAAIGFDRLPKLGPLGRVIATHKIPLESMKIVDFANGVKLIIYPITGSSGRVFVMARFGRGRQALPVDKPTVAWAAPVALVASGIGDLGANEIDQLTSGRRINLEFDIGDDAFALRSQTNAADLADELKLMAAKIASPRWDAAPVARARAAFLAGQDTIEASPQGILGRDLKGLLLGNDPRWALPNRQDIDGLTAERFRALWEPLIKTGPIELLIFGDMNEQAAIKAAAASFGALKPRQDAPIASAALIARGPLISTDRVVRYHNGDADQAAAVLAWPTGGGLGRIFESRKLDVLAAIFNDRLFEKLREGEGAAYSPNVINNWRTNFAEGGSLVITSQVKPAGVERFFELSRAIAADLVSHPVSADEFERAVGPMKALVSRAMSSELYWMNELAGATRDPRRIDVALSVAPDLRRITPADVQDAAKAYFIPGRTLEFVVLPRKKAN